MAIRDSIEAAAHGAVFGKIVGYHQSITSLKTNVDHLEGQVVSSAS